jgi:hypothetical protein
VERISARRLRPVAQLPARVRAVILQTAVAALLLALGIVIDKEVAWIVVAMAVTVIGLIGSRRMSEHEIEHPPPTRLRRHKTGLAR